MNDTPRPAYVQFEVRAVEDRSATLESGHYVPKDVIYALVTPAGTKDRLEKEAEEWIKSMEEGVQQERIPSAWLDYYRKALQAFKDQQEVPLSGTSIKDWSALSPSQVKILLDANLRTIEEVAEATEEAVSRIGMGGRALKEKARAWIDSSAGTGKVAAELETLRTANTALENQNESLLERVKTLETQLEALKPAEGKK
jgi:hypothetical protein